MTKPIDRTVHRVNMTTRSAADAPRPATDKVPARYIAGGPKLLPKLPGMAAPSRDNIFERNTYRVGDGEVFQQMRPGADDHLKCLSRGFST
jgi:hypothetical protein